MPLMLATNQDRDDIAEIDRGQRLSPGRVCRDANGQESLRLKLKE